MPFNVFVEGDFPGSVFQRITVAFRFLFGILCGFKRVERARFTITHATRRAVFEGCIVDYPTVFELAFSNAHTACETSLSWGYVAANPRA